MTDIGHCRDCRWRAIEFAPEYEVSDTGLVRSYKYRNPKILAERKTRGDYRTVCLRVNRRTKYYRLSRLVLTAFVGPCPFGCEASHKDGDRSNNTLENLAWESHVDNVARKRKHGTQMSGERHTAAKLTETQVKEIRRRKDLGESYYTLAGEYGVTYATIWSLCKNKHWREGNAAGGEGPRTEQPDGREVQNIKKCSHPKQKFSGVWKCADCGERME